jgi:hypothetical protein
MERVEGIEPSQPAWKAGALPLSYTRPQSVLYIFLMAISRSFFILCEHVAIPIAHLIILLQNSQVTRLLKNLKQQNI